MNAKSNHEKSVQKTQNALEESLKDGFRPTLALIFISLQQDIDTVCDLFNEK